MDDAEFVENFDSDMEEELDTSVNVSRSRVVSRRRSRNVNTPNVDSRLRSSVSERNGANDSGMVSVTSEECGDTSVFETGSKPRSWPYDPETSVIDLKNLRSTDLPFNSYVHMPPPLPEKEEIKYQNLKRDLVSVAKKYVSEVKTKAEEEGKKFENLTEVEEKGLLSLQKRDDIVVFQTDKSGRMAVDTRENYVKATEPLKRHISDARRK